MVKAVKLADIAAELNVSVVTVSKALSGQKGVSEELRKKIKELADELGYTPIHANQRTGNKSYTIGIITKDSYFKSLASFYWKMYQEVVNKAVKNNCFTMLELISGQSEKNMELPKIIEEKKVDGVIIIGKMESDYLELLNRQCEKLPIVYLDFYDDKFQRDSVISSSFYGAYQITSHLIKLGHTRIAYVGTLLSTESIMDRYLGYRKALLEHGLKEKTEWIINDREPDTGIIGLEHHFELPKVMPTAFVCNNDVSAYALIKVLENEGYRIPEDISVVGYDDYIYPEFGTSTITTYAVDMSEMARLALRSMIKQIDKTAVDKNIHVVPGKLIIRESSAPVNANRIN